MPVSATTDFNKSFRCFFLRWFAADDEPNASFGTTYTSCCDQLGLGAVSKAIASSSVKNFSR